MTLDVAKFFKDSERHFPFSSSYFQNVSRKTYVRSEVPLQLKTVDKTTVEKRNPPKMFCHMFCWSWSLFLQKLQAVDCRLAMLAQGLYYEPLLGDF